MTGNLSDAGPLFRWLLIVLGVGLLLVLMRWASPVLAPLLLAFFLFALILPFFRWLRARGLGKGIGLVIVFVALLVGGLALGLAAWFSLGQLQTGLAAYSDRMIDRLNELAAEAAVVNLLLSGELLATSGAALSSALRTLVRVGLSFASTFMTSVIIVAFFLLESQRFSQLLRGQLADIPFIGMVPALLQTTVRYFAIRTRLNLITGVGIAIILLVLGVDYSLLWGLWAFFLSYIPWIGLVMAGAPPVLLAFAEFGVGRALLVVAGIAVVNVTLENVLGPAYTGKTLKLSPTTVFLSFFFWAWLLGPVGALVSMPIMVLLMLVFERYEATRWVAAVFGSSSGGRENPNEPTRRAD